MYASTSAQRLRHGVRPYTHRTNALASAVVDKHLSQSKIHTLRHLKGNNKKSYSSLTRVAGTCNIFRLRAPFSSRVGIQNATVATSFALGKKPRASLKLKLKLPKTLARPSVVRSERWTDPEVPIEYARDKLALVGPSMLQALATTSVSSIPSSSSLPKSIPMSYTDSSIPDGFRPTHILAVHGGVAASSISYGSTSTTNAVTLYPVHEVVLAAYCGNLPSLPSSLSSATQESDSTSTSALPLIPINLPSPQTFSLTLHYLYTRNTSILLSSLSSLTSSNPQGALNAIVGVWKNACALGIDDERFWCTLQCAWKGLRDGVIH